MIVLKKLVDRVLYLNRNYFKSGDLSYLNESSKIMDEIEAINYGVYKVLDNCPIFYIKEHITDKEVYHIIDYLCSTDLEETE